MLAEDRLDLAVEATRLGPGEPVIVITKMGKEVARGTVQETLPDGPVHIHIEDQGGGVAMSRMYDPSLYSFIPIEGTDEDEDEAPEPMLGDEPEEPPMTELPLDDRVEAKVRSLGISLVEQPADDGEKSPSLSKPTPANSARQVDGGKGPPKSKDKGPDPRADSREAGASVNLDMLPEALRKKITGVKGLDEAQQDKVMSEISDAALRALKSVGVKDLEIYKTVARLQDAIAPVLGLKG